MTLSQILSILVLLIILFIVVWFMYRSGKNQLNKVLRGERSLDDQDIWLRNTPPAPARVVRMVETRNPKAAGIVKVDLELEIQNADGSPVHATAIWLVEIHSLPQVDVGKTVEVKFDPKHPKRVYPAVSWARLWVFGK